MDKEAWHAVIHGVTKDWTWLRDWTELNWTLRRGLPHSSVGKETTCNAGDPSLIPRSGRSAGDGIGYPLQYSWASLVAQLVNNPSAMQETWDQSLGWEDPLEKGKAILSSILACRIPWTVKSMESQRVRHDWATFTWLHFTFKRYLDFDVNLTTLIKASGISYLEYYISFLFDLQDSTSTLLFFFTLCFFCCYIFGVSFGHVMCGFWSLFHDQGSNWCLLCGSVES